MSRIPVRTFTFLAVVACAPTQPDTGVRPHPDSGVGDSATDSGGDSAVEPRCDDLPWKQVELSWRVGCGVHTDGCVECWGEDGGPETPSVTAEFISVYEDYEHDLEAGTYYPSGCVIDSAQRLSCWAMDPYYSVQNSTDPVVDVAFGGYFQLAVLSPDGVLTAQTYQEPYPPVSGLQGPLLFGDGEIFAVRDGHLTQWRPEGNHPEEVDLGSLEEWRSYRLCFGYLCGIRSDGSAGFLRYPMGWIDVPLPPGSWMTLSSTYHEILLQDDQGWVYAYTYADGGNILSDTPWFTEPMVSVEAVGEASCGITADGWLECAGDMKDLWPPPGSYLLPRH